MNKAIARVLIGLGGILLSAWALMLFVERMSLSWGIGTIGFDDSISLVVLFWILLFGVACFATSVKQGE